MKSLWTYL